MESPHLNSRPDDDDPLVALFRSNSTALPDAGFSIRVLNALPPRRKEHQLHLLLLASTLLGGTAAGLALALLKGSSWNRMADDFNQMGNDFSACGAALSDPWFILAVALTIASLLVPYVLGRQKNRFA